MSKTNKIIYWVATLWLSLGMTASGIMQILQPEEEMAEMKRLGYPMFFFTLLGVWKILGVIAVLIPKSALLKEWAYAGFFFAMSGAVVSHIAVGDEATELFGPILLIVLMVVSWYLRPASRKTGGVANNLIRRETGVYIKPITLRYETPSANRFHKKLPLKRRSDGHS